MATKLNGRPFREAALLGNQPEWTGDRRGLSERLSHSATGEEERVLPSVVHQNCYFRKRALRLK